MNLFRVLEISGSALLAERLRAEIVSANLANAETTRTDSGGPYQRMHVVFGARPARPSFGMMLASLADMHAEDVRIVNLVPPVDRDRQRGEELDLFGARQIDEARPERRRFGLDVSEAG